MSLNIYNFSDIKITTNLKNSIYLGKKLFFIRNLISEREEEAIRVLKLIRESDTKIKEELEEYRISKDDGKINKMSLFKNRIFLKSLALGILLCASTNLGGFSAVSYYLQTIFETTNTRLPSEIASVIIGCTQLFAALCTNFASNKFGRRTILLSSLCGIFFGMVSLF